MNAKLAGVEFAQEGRHSMLEIYLMIMRYVIGWTGIAAGVVGGIKRSAPK